MRKKKEVVKVDWKDASIWVKLNNYTWLVWVALVIVGILRVTSMDSDAFFLASTGRYIVENWEVPKINTFTYHEGLKVIIQQWLMDIVNYFLLDNFGAVGLLMFSVVAMVVNLSLLYKFLGFYTENHRAKILTVLAFSFLLLSWYNTRPTSITMSVLLAELIVLEKVYRDGDKKSLWFIPLLSLIQINCHASLWWFIFVMILPYAFPPLTCFISLKKVIEHFKKYKELWLIMIPSFLVGFINPNGLKGILYLWLSFSSANSDGYIQEMRSATIFGYLGVYIVASAVIIGIYIYKYNKYVNWKNVYLALGTFILAARYIRNIWMVVFGVAPLLALLIKCVVSDKLKVKHTDKNCAILFVEMIVGAGLIGSIIIPSITPRNTEDSGVVPIKAVEYLDTLDKDELKIFNGFNNGAYLEWHGYEVYMDARPELYNSRLNKKADIYDEYQDILSANIDFGEFIDKYDFTHMLVSEQALRTYLECSDKYEEVVEGEGYTLFEKSEYKGS